MNCRHWTIRRTCGRRRKSRASPTSPAADVSDFLTWQRDSDSAGGAGIPARRCQSRPGRAESPQDPRRQGAASQLKDGGGAMEEERQRVITDLLSSHVPDELLRGLALIKEATPHATPADAQQYCELILPLFYIDPLDHPEHVSVIEEAIMVASGLGDSVIPILIQNLEAGDVKAQNGHGQALGWMGAKAVDPLITEYGSTCPDPACGRSCYMQWVRSRRRRSSRPRRWLWKPPDRLTWSSATRPHAPSASLLNRSPRVGCGRPAQRSRRAATPEPGRHQPRHPRQGRAQPGQTRPVRTSTKDQRGQLKRTLLHLTGDDGRFRRDCAVRGAQRS